ncbi:MAG TPA: Spy/CpxP family protein refolding chaperone [Burkholderiales bacterium]|nr:Spy/CpxP family protein refolding chaperone [Burkholderiales bacterium]
MKNRFSRYPSAAAFLLPGLLLSAPAVTVAATPMVLAQAGSPAPAAAPDKTHARLSATDRAEIRIKDLHSKLKITPEQETQWETVAQAMRDNAAKMEDLAEQRSANTGSMTAVDDLKSYQAIAETHAEGLKSLVPAFETLYNTMSDDQKKTADALFGHRHHKGGAKKAAPKGE